MLCGSYLVHITNQKSTVALVPPLSTIVPVFADFEQKTGQIETLRMSLSLSLAKATALFSKHTKTIVWGMQTRAVQGMLDFDYVCSREEPSVAAMVYPFT